MLTKNQIISLFALSLFMVILSSCGGQNSSTLPIATYTILPTSTTFTTSVTSTQMPTNTATPIPKDTPTETPNWAFSLEYRFPAKSKILTKKF